MTSLSAIETPLVCVCVNPYIHIFFLSSALIIVTGFGNSPWGAVHRRSEIYSLTALVLCLDTCALKVNFEYDSVRVLQESSLVWNALGLPHKTTVKTSHQKDDQSMNTINGILDFKRKN